MPICTIQFPLPAIQFNTSLQVGDIVYYCPSIDVGGFFTADLNNITKLGPLLDPPIIFPNPGDASFLNCWIDASTQPPLIGDFIMFSKDNKANLNSLLGYVAEVEFRNNSAEEAELFRVGAEVSESSK